MSSTRELAHQVREERGTSVAKHDESIVTVGDFCIDQRSHRVLVRGHELRLGEDEFEMLMFLTGHRTTVLTPHNRLTTRSSREQVHPSDFLRLLANLQRELESVPGGTRYIRTEPWLVCRFDPGSNTHQCR